MIVQKEFTLQPYSRGFHLITQEIMRQINSLPETGIFHLFIKHTSASISINENADPAVRVDLENSFNKLVPENQPHFTHTEEGSDDMPSHIKVAMMGSSIIIPITEGKLNLGTWQGIYLCEFRDHAGSRKLVATIYS